jgi:hypothetical protein
MRDHGEAFLPVAVEAERFARGVRRAVAIKRGNVGKLAIDAYRLGQAMNLALDAGLMPISVYCGFSRRAISFQISSRSSCSPAQPGTASSRPSVPRAARA